MERGVRLALRAQFTRILIVQSLPDTDGHPGRRLREDIEDRAALGAINVRADLEVVQSRAQLMDVLRGAAARSRADGDKPILHLECHGSTQPDGIQTADGTVVTWDELKPELIELNVATHCHLLVTLASCYGAALGRIVTLDDRAPVMAYVGAMDSVQAGHFADGYGAFYETLLTTGSGDEALSQLRNASGEEVRYFFMTAPGLLQRAYAGLERMLAAEGGDWGRARILRERYRKIDVKRVPSTQEMMDIFRKTKPDTIRRLADHFLMVDLFPENQDRFPVTMNELEAYARTFRE